MSKNRQIGGPEGVDRRSSGMWRPAVRKGACNGFTVEEAASGLTEQCDTCLEGIQTVLSERIEGTRQRTRVHACKFNAVSGRTLCYRESKNYRKGTY